MMSLQTVREVLTMLHSGMSVEIAFIRDQMRQHAAKGIELPDALRMKGEFYKDLTEQLSRLEEKFEFVQTDLAYYEAQDAKLNDPNK